MDSLQCIQLTLRESQSPLDEVTVELSKVQSSPTTVIVQSSSVAIGNDLISTGYCCEKVEDVATHILVTGVDDTVGMSASVESSENPQIASSSPMVASIATIVGDELHDMGYIQSFDYQC